MTASTGTFEFHFKPGKVATETPGTEKWHIYAKADDGGGTLGSNTQQDRTMNWYGEVSIDPATIDFGDVAPGVVDNQSPNFVLTNIANGTYQLQLKTVATWTGDSTSWTLSLSADNTPGNAELALEADDDANTAGAQVVTDAYVLYTGHAADAGPTTEAGAEESINTLWLTLGSTGIVADTYSENIYYQILND